ncbi:MAG: tol-pal system protein YbgF [Rhizobiaceae bacterium]
MTLRTIIGGAVALFLTGASGQAASDRVTMDEPAASRQGAVSSLFDSLPGVFGQKRRAEVQLAQASDPRITQLEEQIRQLSGTIEELNFQILQMQEQMRKMQEDNEFRFQELEKKSDAGGGSTVAGGSAATTPKADRTVAGEPPAAADDPDAPLTGDAAHADSATSKTFGTIVFDKDGNVVGTQQAEQPAPGSDRTVVAALPSTDDPEELYRNAYEFILSGDYTTAETGFREHIDRFPADQRAADAHFWLGEALLGQQKYSEAAEVFLAANRDFPSSRKAPDMLLKLGVSLAGLNQRDVACATFAEVGKRYPGATAALKDRVKQERALAAC